MIDEKATSEERYMRAALADGSLISVGATAIRPLLEEIDRLRAALSDHIPATGQMVPGSTGSAEGWVLVPRKPTEAMVAAAIGPDDGALFGSRKLAADVMRARYRAMIDAAGGRDE